MHIHLNVPWISQYDNTLVERAGGTACFRACRAICAAVGVTVPASTEHRIQLALRETEDGVELDQVAAAAGKHHILTELSGGRPVVVGVHYKAGSLNRDRITDHYMVIIGVEGPDSGNGLVLYAQDPGRRILANAAHNSVLEEHPGGHLVRVEPQWPRMTASMVVPSVESLWKPPASAR